MKFLKASSLINFFFIFVLIYLIYHTVYGKFNIGNYLIYQFEEKLSNIDLIYNFYIYKFDNKNNIYKIIFNGSPDKFIELMKSNNYEFETTNKIWVMK